MNDELLKAAETLKRGGIILYPTDTIWGLGCDPQNESAMDSLFKLKERPVGQALLLLVNSMEMLKNYVSDIHPRIETLLSHHTRPLTIIYPKAKDLPDYALGQDGSVAIRVVKDGICADLIRRFGGAITSTSANKHGESTPKHFGEIKSDIISGVDQVIGVDEEDSSNRREPSVIARYNEKGELDFIRE